MDVGYINAGLWLYPDLCLCTWLLGRAQFKPWGVKKGLMLTYPIIILLQQPLVSIKHALNSEHVLNKHRNTYKHNNARLFSDLMQFSVENESLS